MAPGFGLHLGSTNEENLGSKLIVLGVAAPDYFKWDPLTQERYEKFFKGCENAPKYEEIQYLCDLKHGGTHFGSEPGDTNHANFKVLAEAFSNGILDAENPFYIGYLHHLRVDQRFYADPTLFNQELFDSDYKSNSEETMARLHRDWDNTNDALLKCFPKVRDILRGMPQEVQDIVKFEEGEPKYISLKLVINFVNGMKGDFTLAHLLDDSNWNQPIG